MRRKDRRMHRVPYSTGYDVMQRPDDSIYYVDGNLKSESRQKIKDFLDGKLTMEDTHQEGNWIVI